jgi:hypothetical protein
VDTVSLRKFGQYAVVDRVLFALHAPNVGNLIRFVDSLDLNSQHFGLLLACDGAAVTNDTLFELAERMMKRGMVYLCAWGPGCERVHDVFDEAILTCHPNETDRSVIMTTWHADERLEEGVWFFLNTAFPAEDFEKSCKAMLAVSVADEEWAKQINSALSDPYAFSKQVLATN